MPQALIYTLLFYQNKKITTNRSIWIRCALIFLCARPNGFIRVDEMYSHATDASLREAFQRPEKASPLKIYRHDHQSALFIVLT